jgi:uncharacterized protein DUF4214
MKSTNAKQRDIFGNGGSSADREIFTAIPKNWRQRLGYCSIFATIPAMVISNVQAARTDETSPAQASVPGAGARVRERLNLSRSNQALLKRQATFRLPHQMGSSDGLAPLGGIDDCPGRAIPGGNYTVAAPYVESGDTTGANDTVTSIPGYYYYFNFNYDAHGPDHVYTFTLTSRGPNPQIEVSATSGSYRPLIYLLQGNGVASPCPAGTGNVLGDWWMMSDSRWDDVKTATLNKNQMSNLPLNVPVYLFVDSALNDARGAGAYTIRMQDVTIAGAPAPPPNQIDDSQYFVRQHYRDFLNREPDPEGLAFWVNQITSCGNDQACVEAKRINDSGSFFLSIEFQETGYLAYRAYKAAYGNQPNAPVPITFSEFIPDTQAIGRDVIVRQAGWEQVLENNKRAFLSAFVQRQRFTNAFPPAMSAQEFVDKLNANAGNPLSQTEGDQLASDLFGGRRSRADVLRAIAENPKLVQAESNRAFVLMQYFGYLQRNPNDAPDGNFVGYNFWLDKLDRFNGDFIGAEMVKAFISSTEYRRRFSQ